MTDATPTPPSRTKIADIVRDAGVVGGDAGGPSMADFAGIGALVGASAASLAASTVIGQAFSTGSTFTRTTTSRTCLRRRT